MSVLPRIVVLAAGALGAAALARLFGKEYRRVNDELDAVRGEAVPSQSDRDCRPTLRKDPRTGVYRI